MSKTDNDDRQQVEGFGRLVSGFSPHQIPGFSVGPDFRGACMASATGEWWLDRSPDSATVVWLTAPVPEAVDTTFSFVGESSNLPENAYPPNRAKLIADGVHVLTFDLGKRLAHTPFAKSIVWTEADWSLEFVQKQIRSAVDSGDRQMEANGCCGIYKLSAPGAALRAGEPVELTVALEPPARREPVWFAIRHRDDVLDVTPDSNQEEIQRLQQEIINLKRVVGGMARRSYSRLMPERIETEEVVVHSEPYLHLTTPDALSLDNGDLLVTFREGAEHISLDGKFVMLRSSDGGKTWGDRLILREHEHTDERDGSITQLSDGVVIANQGVLIGYDGEGHFHGPMQESYKGRPPGTYIGRSDDRGRTWTWGEKPSIFEPFILAFTSERIVEHPSGRLLMACYIVPGSGTDRHAAAFFGHASSIAYSSDDRGETWRYLSTIGDVQRGVLLEPALVCSSTGRLISLMRAGRGTGDEYAQANSDDAGETWTPIRPSGIPGRGNPASMLSLEDGRILCVYGSRGDPGGIYAVDSDDNGETWNMDRRRVVRDDFPNWDCCYPSTVRLPDGRIFVAYYFNMFERFFIGGSTFEWK
jgi:hypothetical protein